MSEIFLSLRFWRRLLASGQDRRQTHTRYFWQAANTDVRSTVPKHSKCDSAT